MELAEVYKTGKLNEVGETSKVYKMYLKCRIDIRRINCEACEKGIANMTEGLPECQQMAMVEPQLDGGVLALDGGAPA